MQAHAFIQTATSWHFIWWKLFCAAWYLNTVCLWHVNFDVQDAQINICFSRCGSAFTHMNSFLSWTYYYSQRLFLAVINCHIFWNAQNIVVFTTFSQLNAQCFFLWYSYYNITLSILHVSVQKYVSGLWDTEDSSSLIQLFYKDLSRFYYFTVFHHVNYVQNSEFSFMQYYLILVSWWSSLVDWNM